MGVGSVEGAKPTDYLYAYMHNILFNTYVKQSLT